jgi:hypothetical protein
MASPFDEIRVHTVIRPGLPGDSADAIRMAQIEADHDTLLARPAITSLDAVPGVDTSGAVDGASLVYDSGDATNPWKAGVPTGSIAHVLAADAPVEDNVTFLNFGSGLLVDNPSAGYISVYPVYSGTGSASSASRSDHTHTTPSMTVAAYTASGNLSSGSRLLVSQNVTLASGVPYLIIARLRSVQRGSGGSSYYKLFLNINSLTTRTSVQLQCVGGVPDPRTFEHSHTMTGTGAAITVSASIIYDSGDPVDVRAGELLIELHPAR